MISKTKILIAEHDPIDLELIRYEIEKSGLVFEFQVVQNEIEYITALDKFVPDIILADYTFPSFDGPTAFKIREDKAPDTPFIIVSGTIGEENSIEMIKRGVSDYVLKDKLFTLAPKVHRALKDLKAWKKKEEVQKQLRLSEAQLAEAQAVAKVGSWETDLLDFNVKWSRETFRIFGIDEHTRSISHSEFLKLVHPEDRLNVETSFNTSLNSFSINAIEHRIITATGEIKFVDEHWKIVRDEKGIPVRAMGSCQDITERKHEDEQREFERAHLAEAQKLAKMGSWDYNVPEDRLVWSDELYNVFGIDKKTFLETHGSFLQLVDEKDRKRAEQTSKNTQITGDPFTIEYGITTLFGEKRIIREHGYGKKDETGNVKRLFGTAQDITESKKSEDKINKANRLYSFISQVNQNIVHIQDETSLFRNSCQVAFEFGKFKMAWIGLFDKTKETISLVDQNGIKEEDVHLFTDVQYEKGGPQNWVLKTGSHFICNDVEKDFELHIWKSFVANNGISSFIILPIKKSNQVIGTFNLYASELNFFDKEEIELLTDVTEDISFALDLFEQAKKQHETEELVIKNERRFRALIDKSADMKTLSTIEGELLYGSNSITKFLGYPLDEYMGKYASDFVHPGDMLRTTFQEILQNPGKPFYVQQRMRHKDGSWIWCEGTITNMLEEPGVNALVSNFRDISEKKKIETQQEFDRNNLNALINNTHDMMWSVDRNFNLITSNELFDQMNISTFGVKIEKGTNILSPGFPLDRLAHYKSNYKRAFAGETFTETDYIQFPAELWSEISYYPIRRGKQVIGTACHSRDVTEKRKAEEAVLTALNEKNTILESIGDGFFTVDKNWTVTYWNQQAEKMLGTAKEIILGKHLWEIFYQNIGSASYLKYNQAIETNEVVFFEDFYPTLNKWYDISAYPSTSGLSVYFKDITERKFSEIHLNELHENLLKHAKELALSNAELEQFAYVASHDLQEPLRMITSFLSQLEKKYSSIIDEKGKKYIHFAVDGAKRMRQIILDLLEFSRVGRIEDKLEEIDINILVEEIRSLYRKQISEKNAVISADNLPVINSYNAPLRQVFQNLVGNALKYTRNDQACHIHIAAKESAHFWEFAVADNGIGIAKEYFDKIFIIFQRLHNKDEFSGTGMGLAVTKKIIENLGGKIWISSEEEKGSVFYFTIPKK